MGERRDRRRRRRQLAKVEAGDGSPTRPFRWWHGLYRSMFLVDLEHDDGTTRTHSFEIDSLAWDQTVEHHVDGVQAETSTYPAVFAVPGGHVEVDATNWGVVRRMHLVTDTGYEQVLRPHHRSSEALRARFASRHPRTSRAIEVAAVVVLVTSLALFGLQLADRATDLPVVADAVGSFTSPVRLPASLNAAIGVAAVLAAIERSWSMRHHWLIDVDTWFLG